MVFSCLDGSFCGVSAMNVRRNELEVYVVFPESLFHFVRAFVVKDVEFGRVSIVFEYVE